VFNKDKLLPCFVRIGTIKRTIDEKNDISIETENIDERVFPIFNFFFKKLLIGFMIRNRIKEIKMYRRPNRILNNKYNNKAIKANMIADFTISFDFILIF
tara:strand:+ start:937 stop:1236 length:300 start_codon:yes stop_codon:yes gene_type:complete